jgi:hypothetical protein
LPPFHSGFLRHSGRSGMRGVVPVGVLLSTSLGCARAQSGTAPVPVDQEPHDGLHWTVSQRLSGVPEGQALHWPSLAFKGDTLFVAGNIAPTGGAVSRSVQSSPLVVLRVPGGSAGMPEGQFAFLYPRGVIARDGKYHLFWGETDSVPHATLPAQWPLPSVRSVWHSSYDGAWSRPERLLNEFQIGWGFRGDVVTVDGAGRIHLGLTILREHAGYALAYLRSSASGWQRADSPIPIGNSGSILTWGRDSLAIAYVGFAFEGSREGARVRLIVSGDGGTTWSVSPHPPLSARDPDSPLLSRSADGVLHVGWRESARGGGASSGWEFRSWDSPDGGATWQDRGALPVPSFGSFVAVPGLCSGSALVIEASDGQTLWLTQLTFQEGLSMRRLFPAQWGNAWPGVTAHGGKLVMVWSSTRKRSEPLTAWVAEADACSR